jgi:hypothetical protein
MFMSNTLDKGKKEYGLDKPSHVVVEGKPEGILIRSWRFI